MAWSLKNKESIYDENLNRITIPPESSVIIETNESIWVSNKIAGTYHSKVKLVSRGLSHIGTTLDPLYIGSSLIAIHNNSNQEIYLTPEEDTFVSLQFQYLVTESTITPGNSAGRTDVLMDYSLNQEEKNWLDEDFKTVKDALKAKMQECPDYHKLAQEKQNLKEKIEIEEANKQKIERKKRITWTVIFISGLITSILVILLILLSSKEAKFSDKGWYDPSINLIYTILILVPGSTAVAGLTKIYSDW